MRIRAWLAYLPLSAILVFSASPAMAIDEAIICGTLESQTCQRTERTCTSGDECANNIGDSDCHQGYCYLDPEALAEYNRSKTSFVWGVITLQNDIKELKKPALQIKIPGLNFSDTKQTLDREGYINIPYIGELITALYQYGIALASIIAVVIIIKCGVSIILSAGGEEKMAAYHQIGQVCIGLIILWGSYAFLYTINPELVTFRPLRIKYIEPVIAEEEAEVTEVGTTAVSSTAAVKPVGKNIKTGSGVTMDPALLPKVQAASDALAAKGITLYITSALRSLETQMALIEQNCQNKAGSATCNPKPGRPQTCILKDLDPKNCPHTTGRAIDAWGFQDGKQCVVQADCKRDASKDPCRADACQAAVIEAMRDQGFCNLGSEAWHFEQPKMSGNCT